MSIFGPIIAQPWGVPLAEAGAKGVTMAVDAFWNSLLALQSAGKHEALAIEAQRQKLARAKAAASKDPDANSRALRLGTLNPVIAKNAALRAKYLSMTAKYNEAMRGAAATLKKAGLSVPDGLGGLGFVIPAGLVVATVAVAALGVAWAIYEIVAETRRNLDKCTDLAVRVASDPSATPAMHAAARKCQEFAQHTQPKGPLGLDVSSLIAPLAIVAAILIVPPLLKAGRA